MNGTNRAAVALVSFPGSGSTWVRGLLEQATGVCTGRSVCLGSGRLGANVSNVSGFSIDWYYTTLKLCDNGT